MTLCKNLTLISFTNFPFSFFPFNCRGVRAISSSANGSSIYTAGADGMVGKIESMTGNLLEKFEASTNAIYCLSVSSGMYLSKLRQNSSFLVVENGGNALFCQALVLGHLLSESESDT